MSEYRLFDKERKQYVENFVVDANGRAHLFDASENAALAAHLYFLSKEPVDLRRYSLEQFSGRVDSSSRLTPDDPDADDIEIFEGDIVRVVYKDDFGFEHTVHGYITTTYTYEWGICTSNKDVFIPLPDKEDDSMLLYVVGNMNLDAEKFGLE